MTIFQNQRGMSIIELMVAIVIALLLSLGLFTMFSMSSKNVNNTNNYLELQQNGRFALNIITKELSQAGFFSTFTQSAMIPGLNFGVSTAAQSALTADCIGEGTNNQTFPTSDPARYITFMAYREGSSSLPSCLSGSQPISGSDIIQIKRLVGPGIESNQRRSGRFYMYEKFNSAQVVHGTELPTISGGGLYWEYRHTIFYTAYDSRGDETVPVLKAMELSSNGLRKVSYLDGIEDITIEVGFDRDADGKADNYVDVSFIDSVDWVSPAVRAVAARVSVLVRAVEPDREFDSTGYSYKLNNYKTLEFTDNYRRQVFSAVVVIENETL